MLNYILIHKIGFKIYLCSVFFKNNIYINLILKSIYPYIPRLGVYLYGQALYNHLTRNERIARFRTLLKIYLMLYIIIIYNFNINIDILFRAKRGLLSSALLKIIETLTESPMYYFIFYFKIVQQQNEVRFYSNVLLYFLFQKLIFKILNFYLINNCC